jgi:dTDP-4-dehydrorhamnose reductase
MKVLVIGANGQLGSDLMRCPPPDGVELIAATRADGDITDFAAMTALMERHRPGAVINTAAYHNVVAAEDDPEVCLRVNVVGGWNVARAAKAVGAAVYQVSTDYVFAGTKREPYLEGDARQAVNVYGMAKIATEDIARQVNPRASIVRVSGLYGLAGSAGKGGNFVETMLRLAREGNPIRVVGDQVTAPTNTADIAAALLPIVAQGGEGTFHLAAAEGCSWADFAAAIFERCGVAPRFTAVTTEEFGAPVARPMYSVLGTSRAPALPHWREGLERYLVEKGHARG